MGKTKLEWLKCPRCGLKFALYRFKTKDYTCRRCGCIFKADFVKKTTYEKE